MTKLSKTEENFIEHEVQLRLHSEIFKLNDKKHDEKFTGIDKRFDHMDNKLNLLIGIVIGSFIVPIALHYLHLA